jgi:hypothetical protein
MSSSTRGTSYHPSYVTRWAAWPKVPPTFELKRSSLQLQQRGPVVVEQQRQGGPPWVSVSYMVEQTGYSRQTVERLGRKPVNGFPKLHELQGRGQKKRMLRFSAVEAEAYLLRHRRQR